jgi:hypothetical protein
MPDERFIHPAEGESGKLTKLTDFEYRVWNAYKLAANDVGVMLDSVAPMQTGNKNLRDRPVKQIRSALDVMLKAGLLVRFTHQDESYVCSPRWQDWQRVEYPRQTHLPLPAEDVRATCSEATQMLFVKLDENRLQQAERIKNGRKKLRAAGEDLQASSEELRPRARDRAGNANALANANAVLEGEPEREPPPRPAEVPIGHLQLVVNELVLDYNSRAVRAGLPLVTNPEPSRQRLLNAVRLRPSMDEWRDVLDRAFRSDFLMGRVPGPDGQAFKAFNLWWLVDKDHADKALAGAYENRVVVAPRSAHQPVLGPRTKGIAETAEKYLNPGSKAS